MNVHTIGERSHYFEKFSPSTKTFEHAYWLPDLVVM